MKLNKFLLPIIVVTGFAIYLSLFVVKEINQAIVLQFGDPKKVIAEPGLQVKIPFIQNVVFLDRRILNLANASTIKRFWSDAITSSGEGSKLKILRSKNTTF